MKENRNRGSNFEERLLAELKNVVAQRGAAQETSAEDAARSSGWRRAPRVALGAAAVLAVAAAVLVIGSGGDNTSKAFAVEPQEGGGVTIKVYSAEEAVGLEGALSEAGIHSQVTWLPAGMTCREPRFAPSSAKTSMGGAIGGFTFVGAGTPLTIGVGSAEASRETWRERRRGEISDDEYRASIPNVSLDPASFRSDQTVVISGAPGPYDGEPEGGYEAQLAIAEGPVEPCEPVKAPDGGLLDGVNRVLESESAPGGAAPKAARRIGAAPSPRVE